MQLNQKAEKVVFSSNSHFDSEKLHWNAAWSIEWLNTTALWQNQSSQMQWFIKSKIVSYRKKSYEMKHMIQDISHFIRPILHGCWVLFHVGWRYQQFINEDPTFLIRKNVNSQTFVENFISSVFFSCLLPLIFQNFFHFIPSRMFVFQSEFFIPHRWSNFMLKHIVSLQLIVTDTWFATKKRNNTMPMPTNTFNLLKFSKHA